MAAHFEPREPLTGKLLIASPQIAGRHPFSEAVILVLQDTNDGVFGVALNRPASPEMHVAWNEAIGKSVVSDHLVAGGPVQGPVLAIHAAAELGEVKLQNGLFVSVQKDAIDQLGEQSRYDLTAPPYLIVMGAINWKQRQLWEEIDRGMWFVHEAESDLVFSEPDLQWEYAIESYGNAAIKRLTGLRELPSSPLLN